MVTWRVAELRRQSLESHRQFTSIQRPRNIAEADNQAISPPNKIAVQVSGSESKRHAPKLNNKPKDITPIKSLVRPDLLGAWSDTPFRLMPPFGRGFVRFEPNNTHEARRLRFLNSNSFRPLTVYIMWAERIKETARTFIAV
jgi:hypothetical protein